MDIENINIKEERDKLLKEIEEILDQVTEEDLENATNNELVEYLMIIEKLRAKLNDN